VKDSGDRWPVVDLFSGAGGMSYGFQAHPRFQMVGAADAEIGKPSTGTGAIDCNKTYEANIGIQPVFADLGEVDPQQLAEAFGVGEGRRPLAVLSACPPCTGFSRVNANNHLKDDPRNSLVARTALFVEAFRPKIVVMENARELLNGKFTQHFKTLSSRLRDLGYDVTGEVHMLTRFGLPQFRERAVVIAAEAPLQVRTLEDLWSGYAIRPEAITVRHAIEHLPRVVAGETHDSDPAHTSTDLSRSINLERLNATPRDGGSWSDLIKHPDADRLLIPAMKKNVEAGTPNHFCDVYGRMWWDKPAPTIKRECCHIGNGRYAHPEQDRLCTVREMAVLQGFPAQYRFLSRSRKNMYRNIGDAVPPLVSHQIAWLCNWMLTGERPAIRDIILPDTSLSEGDIQKASGDRDLFRFMTASA
jgi:DNA (cytosine-5)-methyltransferase 1